MRKILICLFCMAIVMTPCYSTSLTDTVPVGVASAAGGLVGAMIATGANFIIPGSGILVGSFAGLASGAGVYSFARNIIDGIFGEDVSFVSDIYVTYIDDSDTEITIDENTAYLSAGRDALVTIVLTPGFKDDLSDKEIKELQEDTVVPVAVRFESESMPVIVLNSPFDKYSIDVEPGYTEFGLSAVVSDSTEIQFIINSAEANETQMTLLYGMDDEADIKFSNATLNFS